MLVELFLWTAKQAYHNGFEQKRTPPPSAIIVTAIFAAQKQTRHGFCRPKTNTPRILPPKNKHPPDSAGGVFFCQRVFLYTEHKDFGCNRRGSP